MGRLSTTECTYLPTYLQELISRGAEMKAHIDEVSLGTNTQEDHVLLLREAFIVCQENHLRIKLENASS